MLRQRS
jgi:hypothetical protein